MILVIAEHNNESLKSFTLNTIKASSQIEDEIHVLVAGNNCDGVSKQLSEVSVVKKIFQAKSEIYDNSNYGLNPRKTYFSQRKT